MGNLDFTHQLGFSWYCVLLVVAGLAMVALGLIPGINRNRGVLNLLVGIGFLGYGIYLVYIFHGGTYVVFFQAFIVPLVLIASSFRDLRYANLRRRGNTRLKKREAAMSADLARERAAVQAALAEAQAQHSARSGNA